VSPASDVFSLGVTLFELLTGALPFREAAAGHYPQLMESPQSLRKLRPKIPKGLEQAVLSCLERDPANRPKLGALIPQLHRFIRGPVRMWPVTLDEHLLDGPRLAA
jgi:serine/threonine-protein kinase